MGKIPRPEEYSTELATLAARQAQLTDRHHAIARERAAIHAKASTSPTDHQDRVAALVAGIAYEPPLRDRDMLAQLADEDRDIRYALDELAQQKIEKTRIVSREIVEQHMSEYRGIAKRFWEAMCLAAGAHRELGTLRQDFMRAGVDPAGLRDFGRDLFGEPNDRNNDLAIDLRKAVRDGFIKETQFPEIYR